MLCGLWSVLCLFFLFVDHNLRWCVLVLVRIQFYFVFVVYCLLSSIFVFLSSFLFSLLVVVCHLMVDVDAWCFVVILVFSILFVCLFRGCACINWCENLRS